MSHVLARVQGRLGRLTLNRPERINALSLDMVDSVSQALRDWAADPQVLLVLIDGAGERGLCAGGDIREVYSGIQGAAAAPVAFWGREYEMNAQIAHYRKPVVSYMDGIVFGGGVGISAHGSVRIVTERSAIAMPETAIGLCPDVGSLYLLARAPGALGVHAALTGARLDGLQAIHAGLADHLLPAAELPALTEQLTSGVLPPLPEATGTTHPRWIDDCYTELTVEDIMTALRQHPETGAQAAVAILAGMSPTAVKVTLAAVRRAASMTLDQVLAQDLRVCGHFLHHPDLAEGIRARVIDKDRSPRWNPADLAEVSSAAVAGFFAPLPAVTDVPA